MLYVHVTLLPVLMATGELKTKPTQHSVKELRGIGIQPDVIVLRSDHPVSDEILEKIALFTDVATDAVIPAVTADTIYEVPLQFEAAGLGELVVRELGLAETASRPDLTAWRALVDLIKRPKPALEIALVGKYIELPDAYMSVTEALRHAAWANGVDARIRWVNSEDADRRRTSPSAWPAWPACSSRAASAIAASRARSWPPGSPGRTRCRTWACAWACSAPSSRSPGRRSARRDANSTEFEMFTANPVIDFMPDQRDMEDKGGTMRLGLYPARLTPGTKAAAVYGTEVIYERHRHRFEVNNRYRQTLEGAGMILSGQSPGRPAGRDRRAARPPLVRGQPVPPRIQEPARPAAPAVRRLRRECRGRRRRPRAGAHRPVRWPARRCRADRARSEPGQSVQQRIGGAAVLTSSRRRIGAPSGMPASRRPSVVSGSLLNAGVDP